METEREIIKKIYCNEESPIDMKEDRKKGRKRKEERKKM